MLKRREKRRKKKRGSRRYVQLSKGHSRKYQRAEILKAQEKDATLLTPSRKLKGGKKERNERRKGGGLQFTAW